MVSVPARTDKLVVTMTLRLTTAGMATLDRADRSSLVGVGLTGRTLLKATFTLVETLALGLWLTLVVGSPPLSAGSVLGLAVLSVGLLLKNVLTEAAVNGLSLDIPARRLLGISVLETCLWAVWLAIADATAGVVGVLVAGVFFAVVLVPQHTIECNVLRGADPFESVFDLGTVGCSLVEAVGATLWLLFVFEGALFQGLLRAVGLASVGPGAVGLGLLAVFLLIEHDVGLALARRA